MIGYPPPGKIKEILIMIPRTMICILGILLLTTACATNPAKPKPAADTAAATANTPGDAVATNDNKLVCHYETVTGSNLATKVCAYQKAWDKYNEKTRENAEEYTRRARESATLTAPMTPSEQVNGRGTITGPMN